MKTILIETKQELGNIHSSGDPEAINIIIGSGFTELIEPGLIPPNTANLILPREYIHPTDTSKFPPNTTIHLHTGNIILAPTDRDFCLWDYSAGPIIIPKLGMRNCSYYNKGFNMGNKPIYTTDFIPQNCLDKTPEKSIFELLSSVNSVSNGIEIETPNYKPNICEPIITDEFVEQMVQESKANASKDHDLLVLDIVTELKTKIQEAVRTGTFHDDFSHTVKRLVMSPIHSDFAIALKKYIPTDSIYVSVEQHTNYLVNVYFSYP